MFEKKKGKGKEDGWRKKVLYSRDTLLKIGGPVYGIWSLWLTTSTEPRMINAFPNYRTALSSIDVPIFMPFCLPFPILCSFSLYPFFFLFFNFFQIGEFMKVNTLFILYDPFFFLFQIRLYIFSLHLKSLRFKLEE